MRNENLSKRLAALGLATSLAVSLASGGALAGDFFGADFEEFTGIPADAATLLTDAEMDDLRGGFLGFFFSVHLSGFVETEGVLDATLDVNASLGDQSGGLLFNGSDGDPSAMPDLAGVGDAALGPAVTVTDTVTGEIFRVQALIGDGAFNGANMVGLISQSPGNMNNIGQILQINLAVIEVAESDLPGLRAQLRPIFGF
jgi:hypothetical protein